MVIPTFAPSGCEIGRHNGNLRECYPCHLLLSQTQFWRQSRSGLSYCLEIMNNLPQEIKVLATSKTSKLIQVLPSQMAEVGELSKRRRRELGLTQQDVADRYNENLTDPAQKKIDRFRIAKIEMAAQPRPGDGAAKALHPAELRALGSALEYPPELILGSASDLGVIWDSLSNPKMAEDVLHLLGQYEMESNQLLSWAEFLPCSLETPEFMHAHHLSIFRDIPDPQYKKHLVDLFDGIGSRRRKRLLDHKGSPRSWEFRHFMFLRDLKKIVSGTEEYLGFSRKLRTDCVKYLISLLSDPNLKIFLILSDAKHFTAGKAFFSGMDCLIVFDKKIAIWRDRRGYLYWSTAPRVVAQHYELLRAFQESPNYGHPRTVVKFLQSLLNR